MDFGILILYFSGSCAGEPAEGWETLSKEGGEGHQGKGGDLGRSAYTSEA